MKTKTKTTKFLAFLVVAVLAVSLISVGTVSADKKKGAEPYNPSWAWFGYNSMIQDYYFEYGYPSYDQHPRWLGELSGTWQQIGEQYGQRAGDLIRMVFESWYRERIDRYPDLATMLEYIHQIEDYYKGYSRKFRGPALLSPRVSGRIYR